LAKKLDEHAYSFILSHGRWRSLNERNRLAGPGKTRRKLRSVSDGVCVREWMARATVVLARYVELLIAGKLDDDLTMFASLRITKRDSVFHGVLSIQTEFFEPRAALVRHRLTVLRSERLDPVETVDKIDRRGVTIKETAPNLGIAQEALAGKRECPTVTLCWPIRAHPRV
jgi:hypothetical protein